MILPYRTLGQDSRQEFFERRLLVPRNAHRGQQEAVVVGHGIPVRPLLIDSELFFHESLPLLRTSRQHRMVFTRVTASQFLVGEPRRTLTDNFNKRSSQRELQWPASHELNSFGTHTS
jgi:hypothetical protein